MGVQTISALRRIQALFIRSGLAEEAGDLQAAESGGMAKVLVENGEHGYYTAEVAKDIFEAYFGLNDEITEDRKALSYMEKKN